MRRQNWAKRVPDLVRNRLVMRLNQHYFTWVLLGLALPALLGWALTGTAREPSAASCGAVWSGSSSSTT